ncbi:MAG: hypothetical protein Q8O54_02735 [Brevundimonas sp.]|nr:hypothetical protein [Brevundimonas sp.]
MKTRVLNFLPAGLLAIGILSLFFAAVFDTAPNGTHNIGLMQEQMMWLGFSSLCLVISAVMYVGSQIATAIAGRFDGTRG